MLLKQKQMQYNTYTIDHDLIIILLNVAVSPHNCIHMSSWHVMCIHSFSFVTVGSGGKTFSVKLNTFLPAMIKVLQYFTLT